ncbi:MAG: NAD-dependent epimerase/dehydratase family protein [Pseudomonadota bacterium]
MKVLVLGGDGFCGWPTALHLSSKGHEIVIADNFSRRRIDQDLGVQSLTPIRSLRRRISRWHSLTGREIAFHHLDVAEEYDKLLALLRAEKPDAVIHFAEQRAAPFSMKSARHKSYTMRNNVCGTEHILSAIVETGADIHLVHLGTMGVYGYGGTDAALPDGYLPVFVPTAGGDLKRQEIVFPADPGSVYHLTKVLDHCTFQYYAKNDRIRITDLHQGIVWGTQTPETGLHPDLINRFDYDGDYGTVLNRFLVQSAIGYPLTVHGTGGQTRAFIHISDTVRCIELALDNPPERGDRVRVANQIAETRQVRELAMMIAERTGCDIAYVDNPRNEAAENALCVRNDVLRGFGWDPVTLEDGLLAEVEEIALIHRGRCDVNKIPAMSTWTTAQSPGLPAFLSEAAE